MNTKKQEIEIAFVGGSWSSNIGNAFYNLGTEALLKSIDNVEVFFVPDPPQWKAPTMNDFDLIGNLEVDYVILTGPCLNLRLEDIYEKTFKSLSERGIRIGFLSAGMSLYDEGEANKVADFLNRFQIEFIFTRDTETYDFFSGRLQNTFLYDGICNSMFLNDAVSVPNLSMKDYYVFNFDHSYEPYISIKGDDIKIKKGVRNFLGFKRRQKEINGNPIIRTNNNDIGTGYEKIYRFQNTYHSDLPYGYLTLLKNAKIVFSERVHTCAATLILGNKAQFIPMSDRSFEKRSNIFKRLNLNDIYDNPVSLNPDFIEAQKSKLKKELTKCLSE